MTYETQEMEKVLEKQFMQENGGRRQAYICSPLRADSGEEMAANMYRARQYMYYAVTEMGLAARAPHAYLPMLVCDRVPAERELALQFGLRLLEACGIMLVCGDRLSTGMKGEILHAVSMKTRMVTFNKSIYRQVTELVRSENGDESMVVFDGGHPFLAGTGELRELQKGADSEV